jgi:hypothetical protein
LAFRGAVDDAYGDRNLVCTCLPVSAYAEKHRNGSNIERIVLTKRSVFLIEIISDSYLFLPPSLPGRFFPDDRVNERLRHFSILAVYLNAVMHYNRIFTLLKQMVIKYRCMDFRKKWLTALTELFVLQFALFFP